MTSIRYLSGVLGKLVQEGKKLWTRSTRRAYFLQGRAGLSCDALDDQDDVLRKVARAEPLVAVIGRCAVEAGGSQLEST